MSFGLPLSDALWADLYTGTADEPQMRLSESEWAWLKQVTQIPPEGRDISDPLSPAVEFRLRHENFWICLKKSRDFPLVGPIVKCSFRPAFFFDWLLGEGAEEKSSLASVVAQFREYCEQLDEAIGLIKSLEEFGKFSVTSYVLDEEETDFMVVHIDFEDDEGAEEQITVRIDWRSPNEFPSELSCTNETRFREIDCDSWNAEKTIAENLAKLYGIRVDDFMDTFYRQFLLKSLSTGLSRAGSFGF